MGLFGAFKSLLCLTILNGLTMWVARACLGTTGNIFCPYNAPYRAPTSQVQLLSIEALVYSGLNAQ